MNLFPELNTDMLTMAAKRWAKDIKNEFNITISKIALYSYHGGIAMGRKLSEKFHKDDGTRYISPLKYAIILSIDCPGKAHDPGGRLACQHLHINEFILLYTSHMTAKHVDMPEFPVKGILTAYNGSVPETFEDEWVFLPTCIGPGCDGIEIPEYVRADEPGVVLYESVQETNQQQPMELDSTVMSRVLIKGWRLREAVGKLSEESELAIWNMWVKPIVDLHYNGSIHYNHTDDFKKITPDDFEALWEQYIAPVICSNIPPWLKYPQSMDQGELESLIGENIWEPEDFVSEIILPLKAGREPGLVDPFFRCLTSIIRRGDLPVLLAYIAQDRGCGVTTLNVLSGVCTPGGDFPKDRMTQQDELAVWDRWIRPIIVKHFNGRIEYQFFNEPDVIAPDHINEVLREMLELFVYDYAHGPFPTDCFLKEVMDRLRAGFHKYEGVDLTELFNDFLSWTMDGGHLPAFLAYIDHERGGDVCETEQAETSHGASPVPIVPDKDLLNVMADNGTSLSNLPEKGFYTILEKYHADIGMFWESLSRKAKDRHGSIEVAQDFDLYDLAKEAYTDNSQHFVALKLADIDKREFYSRNAKPKRKIVGSILQKIVWREQPHMFGHPEIRNNTQWLFDQFNNHGL